MSDNRQATQSVEKKSVQASGYSEAGASFSRRALRGFHPNSGSPAQDINLNLSTLRQRCRMLYMGAPIAASAINTTRTKVVGTGLRLNSSIDNDVLGMEQESAKKWQRRAEAEFQLWAGKAQNCDMLKKDNFYKLQNIAFLSSMQSGDCFVIIRRVKPTSFNPYSLRLQLVEADRIRTPIEYGSALAEYVEGAGEVPSGKPGAGHKIYDGIEVDENGAVVAYYVHNSYPYKINDNDWTRVLAFGESTGLPNVLRIGDSERCDQYRSVPYLAKVIEPLLQLRRYTESELMAAVVQSLFTAWIETETDPATIPFNEANDSDPDAGSNSENEYDLGPGTVIHLKPGEKVQFSNPNIPTAGFDTFVRALCRIIGSGLEIPYDVLMKEFNSSYSASRAALLEAWETIKMRRADFVDTFCKPIYEIFLAEAVALGRLNAPGFFVDPLIRDAWCKAQWIGPVQGQIDPKKEVDASISAVSHGFKTNAQVTREMGGDWDSNITRLKEENKRKADANKSQK